MATYAELIQASENFALNQRVRVACIVAAEKIRSESTSITNHANRLKWAAAVFSNPDAEARRMLWAALAQNRALTLAQITTADDAAVQASVDAAVDVFAV